MFGAEYDLVVQYSENSIWEGATNKIYRLSAAQVTERFVRYLAREDVVCVFIMNRNPERISRGDAGHSGDGCLTIGDGSFNWFYSDMSTPIHNGQESTDRNGGATRISENDETVGN
jgi:hypothetical protein